MGPLPPTIIQTMSSFAPLFSARVWPHAQVLLTGAILAPGKRPVSALLRVLGLDHRSDFQTYHRVLNQRWTVETTFEEARAHLGMETQRQWNDQAIARTTPVVLALFAMVAILADTLHKKTACRVRQTAWYRKTKPTFADALAWVRNTSGTIFQRQGHPQTGKNQPPESSNALSISFPMLHKWIKSSLARCLSRRA